MTMMITMTIIQTHDHQWSTTLTFAISGSITYHYPFPPPLRNYFLVFIFAARSFLFVNLARLCVTGFF